MSYESLFTFTTVTFLPGEIQDNCKFTGYSSDLRSFNLMNTHVVTGPDTDDNLYTVLNYLKENLKYYKFAVAMIDMSFITTLRIVL